MYSKDQFAEGRHSENILLHCMFLIQILFLHRKYFQAYDLAKKNEALLDKVLLSALIPEIILYYSFTLTALFGNASQKERKDYIKQLNKNRKKMKKGAASCIENILHKYLLIEAEVARIQKKYIKAEKLYNEAIQSAKVNYFYHIEAIANELAAKFYSERGYEKIARTYMTDVPVINMLCGVDFQK